MMVLVRKNELACREHWDGGLWEPRDAAEPAPVAATSPAPTLVAEAPVSDRLREQYTDRVTSVGVAPASRPAEELSGSTTSEQTGRHEAAKPVTAQPVERTIPSGERPQISADQETPATSSALRREAWDASLPEIKRDVPVEPLRNEPPRAQPLAAQPPAPATRTPRASDDIFSRSWGAPRAFDDEQLRPVAPRRTNQEPRATESESPPPVRARQERSSNIDDLSHLMPGRRANQSMPVSPPVSRPVPPPNEPDIERFGSNYPTGSTGTSSPSDAPVTGGRRGWTEPFATADQQPSQRPPEAAQQARPEREPAPRQREARRGQPESNKSAPNPKLASLPRCCGTCRDFRPAEGGERGWCNNPYAFDHRRMVRKSDLACRSTIGDWWIPTDDWWMQQGDYSHHGRPTPIVDDLLRQLLDSRANGTNARNNGRG